MRRLLGNSIQNEEVPDSFARFYNSNLQDSWSAQVRRQMVYSQTLLKSEEKMIFYSKGGGWRKNQISHPEWSVNRETGQMRNRPLMTIAVSWFFARWHFPLPDRVLTWLQMILLQIVGFPERLNPVKEDFAAGLSEGVMFLKERSPGRWVLIFFRFWHVVTSHSIQHRPPCWSLETSGSSCVALSLFPPGTWANWKKHSYVHRKMDKWLHFVFFQKSFKSKFLWS